MKYLILITVFAFVRTEYFRHFLDCRLMVKSHPNKSYQVTWENSVSETCDQETVMGGFAKLCLNTFTNQTNHYDLTKKINDGTTDTKAYGQVACDKFGVDLDSILDLQVNYHCVGRDDKVTKLEANYDVLEKEGIKIKIKCQGGKYIPQSYK